MTEEKERNRRKYLRRRARAGKPSTTVLVEVELSPDEALKKLHELGAFAGDDDEARLRELGAFLDDGLVNPAVAISYGIRKLLDPISLHRRVPDWDEL